MTQRAAHWPETEPAAGSARPQSPVARPGKEEVNGRRGSLWCRGPGLPTIAWKALPNALAVPTAD